VYSRGSNQNVVFEFAKREISVLPTLKASRELKNWYFTMKFFPQHHLYVNNKCNKFQGQNIYQKKDIQNLPTSVAIRKIHCYQLWQPPKDWIFIFPWNFYHETISMLIICDKFQVQKIYSKKDIRNLPICLVVRKNITTAIFDTFPRAEFHSK